MDQQTIILRWVGLTQDGMAGQVAEARLREIAVGAARHVEHIQDLPSRSGGTRTLVEVSFDISAMISTHLKSESP